MRPKTNRHTTLYARITKKTKQWIEREAKRRDMSASQFLEWVLSKLQSKDVKNDTAQ